MNNKLIKRIAAVVLGVAVLSTCAFATTLSGQGYANETLTFSYASAADEVTYIAHPATFEDGEYVYDEEEILAINQVKCNANGTVNVEIDTDLLGDATHIVIRSGDSAGNTVAEVATLAVDAYVASADCTNKGTLTVTIGDVTYEDCPAFDVNFKANVAGTVTLTGLKKVVAGVESNFSSVSAILDAYKNVALEAGSSFTFANIYIVGMPEDVDINTVSIKPVVEFN